MGKEPLQIGSLWYHCGSMHGYFVSCYGRSDDCIFETQAPTKRQGIGKLIQHFRAAHIIDGEIVDTEIKVYGNPRRRNSSCRFK